MPPRKVDKATYVLREITRTEGDTQHTRDESHLVTNLPHRKDRPAAGSRVRKAATRSSVVSKGKKNISSWKLPFPAPKLQIRPNPISEEQKVGWRLINHIDIMHPHSQWLQLLPKRLGHHTAADYALAALGYALDYNRAGRLSIAAAQSAYLSYGEAVSSLKSELAHGDGRAISDDSLICITALSVFEIVTQVEGVAWHEKARSHWVGVNAVLRGRPRDQEVSDVARAIIYSLSLEIAEDAIGRGQTPICEDEQWLLLPPPLRSVAELTAGPTLGRLAYQLTARYPRLLNAVRTIRTHNTAPAKSIIDALELASALLALVDEDAESAVLHQTTVRKTKATGSEQKVVPYQFVFHDAQDLLDSVNYWYTRMAVINCTLKLLELRPSYVGKQLKKDDLQAEKDRYFMNTIMSWHHATELGTFTTARVSRGLFQNWLHLRTRHIWRGMPTEYLLDYVMARLPNKSFAWANGGPKSIEDFDVIADILVGGPLSGFLALGRSGIGKLARGTK